MFTCGSILSLSGCVSRFDEVNSRSMGTILRSCENQCEFHLVLQRAEDRLKRSQPIDAVTPTCRLTDIYSAEMVSNHTAKETEGITNKLNLRDAIRCKILV